MAKIALLDPGKISKDFTGVADDIIDAPFRCLVRVTVLAITIGKRSGSVQDYLKVIMMIQMN